MKRIYNVPNNYATIHMAETIAELGFSIPSKMIKVIANNHIWLYENKQLPNREYMLIPTVVDAINTIESKIKIVERISQIRYEKNGKRLWFIRLCVIGNRFFCTDTIYVKARTIESLDRIYLRRLLEYYKRMKNEDERIKARKFCKI